MADPTSDPGVWKQIAEWLWVLLLMPVAGLWKKIDQAATKTELKNAIEALAASDEKNRTSVRELFTNAEADRRRYEDRFREMQKEIYEVHMSVAKGGRK